MSVFPPTWSKIFEMWRDPASPTDGRMVRNFAADMGVTFQIARAWHKCGGVPANYWRRLVGVIAARHGVCVTCDDLAVATEKLRPPKLCREAA